MATQKCQNMTEMESAASSNEWKSYSFIAEPVPKYSFTNPEAEKLINSNKPVILRDTNLVTSVLHWNISYLEEHIGDGDFSVLLSDSRYFKYHDTDRVKGAYKDFRAPTVRTTMKFQDFATKFKNWKPGEKHYYLQQPLNGTVGKDIVEQYLKFNWMWASKLQKENNWGPLTTNLLLIGQPGNTTPCHYDEQQNMFAQVLGSKRFLLFPPEQFENLYPPPIFHPHDRQSQVDFDNPNYEQFPLFCKAKGMEAIVHPGEVLYLPMYWWHHVETSPHDPCNISLTFWYKAPPVGKIEYPLEGHHKVAMMRNVEKILLEALKEPDEVTALIRTIVQGRYLKACIE